MKTALRVALAAFVLLPTLNSPQLWATPAQTGKPSKASPTKAAPRVTRDNFVSLSWWQSGGFAGLTTSLEVEGNVLSYFPTHRMSVGGSGGAVGVVPDSTFMPLTRVLSNNQLDSLISKLNQNRIPALVGNYRQPNLADGFNETLVLTISDKNDQDQQFTIENYGDTAPKGYFAFMTSFRKLAGQKFPDSPFAPAKVTAPRV